MNFNVAVSNKYTNAHLFHKKHKSNYAILPNPAIVYKFLLNMFPWMRQGGGFYTLPPHRPSEPSANRSTGEAAEIFQRPVLSFSGRLQKDNTVSLMRGGVKGHCIAFVRSAVEVALSSGPSCCRQLGHATYIESNYPCQLITAKSVPSANTHTHTHGHTHKHALKFLYIKRMSLTCFDFFCFVFNTL